jgi:hypothetical protein
MLSVKSQISPKEKSAKQLYFLESLGFGTLTIVWNSKYNKTQCFGKWICFCCPVVEVSSFKGTQRVGVPFLHLKTETSSF